MPRKSSSTPDNDREKRCEWCRLPKFGDNRCICDNPKYTMMEQCEQCESWKDVDHVYLDEESGDVVCSGRCIH